MPGMLQTLESLSWNISLTVLLHSIESEKAALFDAGDHTGLQVFAKALTLRNYEKLWSCSLTQVKQACNPNCMFGESLLEFPDFHSEHIPWTGTVNIGNTETTDFRAFCKATVITVPSGSLCSEAPRSLGRLFGRGRTLGRVFECKLFLQIKKITQSKRNLFC